MTIAPRASGHHRAGEPFIKITYVVRNSAARAAQAVKDGGPRRAAGGPCDEALLSLLAVQLAQRCIELLRIAGGVARHAQPEIHALVGTRECEHGHLIADACDLPGELARGDEERRRARRVMALEPAGMSRRRLAFLRHV